MNTRNPRLMFFMLVMLALASVSHAVELYRGHSSWFVLHDVKEGWQPNGTWTPLTSNTWVNHLENMDTPVVLTKETESQTLSLSDAKPLPLPPVTLPNQRDAWGDCAIRSLSVRFDSLLQRTWTLPPSDQYRAGFLPYPMPDGTPLPFELTVEDAQTGETWEAVPIWQAQEGTENDLKPTRVYIGTMDHDALSWAVLIIPDDSGRFTVQGRVMSKTRDTRLLHVKMGLRLPDPGSIPWKTLQNPFHTVEEFSPSLCLWPFGSVSFANNIVAAYTDRTEPRYFQVVNETDFLGFHYQLALTHQTANFPTSAAFAFEVQSWVSSSDDPNYQWAEATARLPQPEKTLPMDPVIYRYYIHEEAHYQPLLIDLNSPVPLKTDIDVLSYLNLLTSIPFIDRKPYSSAFLCAARDENGSVRFAPRTVLFVNPDPDYPTEGLLEIGQNRAAMFLDLISALPSNRGVRFDTTTGAQEIDYGTNALFACDYPAIWENDVNRPAVALSHANVELLAVLSCKMRNTGQPMLLQEYSTDGTDYFSTYYADAFLTSVNNPMWMLRTRMLAGTRPVFCWTQNSDDPTLRTFALQLGFWPVGGSDSDWEAAATLAPTPEMGHIPAEMLIWENHSR